MDRTKTVDKNNPSHRHRGNRDIPVEPNPVPFGLPAEPPDDIYEVKRNRVDAVQDYWEVGSVSYIPHHIEYIEGEGTFVHYQGLGTQPAPAFPSKCVMPVRALKASDGMKRITINTLRFLSSKEMIFPLMGVIVMGNKRRAKLLTKACEQYNHMGDLIVGAYVMQDGYYSKFPRQIIMFVWKLLTELGVEEATAKQTAKIIALMFEYDNAYRWRTQDLITEANYDELVKHFPKEIKRLLKLEEERENIAVNDVTDKFRAGARVLTLAWKIPILRKAIRKGLQRMDWDAAKLDEADIYHTILYGDYNVAGKNLKERLEIYKTYHGEDEKNWPPRVLIRNTQ